MGSVGRDSSRDATYDTLIIGGGMGGVYGLYSHRKRFPQRSVRLVEAGGDFGGVWYWNRYPGARVDSECPLYQLAIPELWKEWNWDERFPGHEELRKYYAFAEKKLQLKKDCEFRVVVEGVEYDVAEHKWRCSTRDGRIISCTYLVLCTGSSYKKHFPDFANMSSFEGTLVHSAAFPEEGIDVKNKRVAVIGNGATGVQIIQDVAKEDSCHLTAFVRTPNTAFPMAQRKMTVEEQEHYKTFYDFLFQAAKRCRSGFPNNEPPDTKWSTMTPEARRQRMEECWERGGFAYFLSVSREFLIDKEVNKDFYRFWAEKVRSRMKDGYKRDIVAPAVQDQWFGTKRPSLEQDYYEMLDKDNVDLVNLKTDPIKEFTSEGIVTTSSDGVDKLHKFDIIMLATGYDSMTGSLMDLYIKDTDGKLLQDKWSKGVETYLGLMIHKMPNMFMVYSPQAPTALTNGPPIIESQIDWIMDTIAEMDNKGLVAIDPQDEPAKKWRQAIQDMNNMTLYPLENSWYMGANIPGKVREQLVYLAGVEKYNFEIRDALDGFKGFDLTKKADVTAAA